MIIETKFDLRQEVYYINVNNEISVGTISQILFTLYGVRYFLVHNDLMYYQDDLMYYQDEIFATKEEAEQKLKEME